MVNWNSSTEIAHDSEAFARFMHALLGLYLWEFATTLNFDYQFLSGKKNFRWPLFFYFAGRYVLLFALIGIAIALNVTDEIHCQSLYTFNQLFGNAAIGLASINLSIRTMAVWNQKWFIVIPLTAIILGHWSLLLHGVLLKASWISPGGCVIVSTDNRILAVTFIYTMVFDFIVLCLTGWKLAFPVNARSRLVTLIFRDGLIFFMIAFLANLIATIFMLLNLNAVMSIIANVPAAIASTIVACRAVRRLTNYLSPGPEICGPTNGVTLEFRSQHSQGHPIEMPPRKIVDGVHVQMDTFTSPSDSESVRSMKPYEHGSHDEATIKGGRVMAPEESDIEAQSTLKSPPFL